MRTRTKIVCTIGPAVSSYEKILELIDAGMSVARLNFSHGTHEEHSKTIQFLKRARAEKGIPLAIMLDTHGPKIRVGKLPGDLLVLKPGDRLKLVPDHKNSQRNLRPDFFAQQSAELESNLHQVVESEHKAEQKKMGQIPENFCGRVLGTDIPIQPMDVLSALHPGMSLLFDDGYIVSQVVETKGNEVIVEIKNEGVLKSGKGVNIPGAIVPLPALTASDIDDLKFGCKHDVDFVAASFIRSAHNILSIKKLLAEEGKGDILVIAKIESTQGVENFDSIVQVADGIMVARGDLGVEVDLAIVPKLQKMMIRKCYQACKPVVTATQMLESMIQNPRPTRAEVSDVANAIYDGTSLVMLSGETAVGKYPIETVQRMREIVQEAESDFNYHDFFTLNSQRDYHDVSSALSMAAVKTAYSANAKCIFAFTASGGTARLVSRLRPSIPIIAVTPSMKIYNQLAFNWGVVPVFAEGCKNAKEAFAAASEFAMQEGLLSFGDLVVVTAGAPFGKKGSTNMMMVEHIGEVLVRGHKGYGAKVSGKVRLLLTLEECHPDELEGKIAVISHCDHLFLPVLKKAAGVILQNFIGDSTSEKTVALLAKTFEIPTMSRADGAMSILKEGEEVTLDPQKGLVYRGTGRE